MSGKEKYAKHRKSTRSKKLMDESGAIGSINEDQQIQAMFRWQWTQMIGQLLRVQIDLYGLIGRKVDHVHST